MYVGQKNCKTASSVSRSLKGYGTSVATQTPAVVTRNFRTQCKPKPKQYQDQKYQHQKQPTTISSSKMDKNKTATKQSTVYKSPFTRHSKISEASNSNARLLSTTTMETNYNSRGTTNKQKYNYHPSLPNIDGPRLNTTQNQLRVRSNLMKEDKEENKASKSNGK